MRLTTIKKAVAIGALAALVTTGLAGCTLLPGDEGSDKDCFAISAPVENALTEPLKVQKDVEDKCPGELTQAELMTLLDIDDDLDYEYPQSFLDLVKKYGYKTEIINGEEVPVLVAGTTKSVEDKISTDAILAPLIDRSPEEVMAHMLAEPDYAGHIISGLFRTPIGDTTFGAMTNNSKWMTTWEDPADIDDWAEAAIAGDDEIRLLAAKKIALPVFLLKHLIDSGIQDDSAIFHFRLTVETSGGVLDINQSAPEEDIPEFALVTEPYNGTFLVLEVIYKGQTTCTMRVGINVMDGRYAYLGCKAPPPEVGCVTCVVTPPCYTCLTGKNGHIPYAGMDDTEDSGEGIEPPAPAPTEPPSPPAPVITTPPPPPPVVQPDEGGDSDGHVDG